ncbi:MAG: tetratricopeptide repeat protein [Clostridia bacterium]|nr:tetratricopeptide repeat protein [Clostridia bacterium]
MVSESVGESAAEKKETEAGPAVVLDTAQTTAYDQYDMCYSIAIGEQGIWTPFASAKKVDFTLSDSEILTMSANGATVDFTGQKKGQSVITAKADGQTATACITVKEPFVSDAEQEGNIPYWLDYFAYALEGLSPELQEEYMMSVGDYMALVLPDKQYDRTFVNMAKAAATLYPTAYLINNYAALRMDMEQYDEAKKWLLKALEAGDDPTILTNLAQCEYELGNYDNAMTYAGQAAELEPNYGLAHLVMTCVHLQRGDDILAIETLFKSMRSTYTETTSDLLRNLYRQVLKKANMTDSAGWEKLPDGTSTYFDMGLGEMVLTEYHMELLFEAVSAGVESDGRDIPANQISLPYPVDPQDALLGGDAWGIAAETVNKAEPHCRAGQTVVHAADPGFQTFRLRETFRTVLFDTAFCRLDPTRILFRRNLPVSPVLRRLRIQHGVVFCDVVLQQPDLTPQSPELIQFT